MDYVCCQCPLAYRRTDGKQARESTNIVRYTDSGHNYRGSSNLKYVI